MCVLERFPPFSIQCESSEVICDQGKATDGFHFRLPAVEIIMAAQQNELIFSFLLSEAFLWASYVDQ